MVFKKMMHALGVGAPSLDTVPDSPDTHPGQPISGRVAITGGDHDVTIDRVVLSLILRQDAREPIELTRLPLASSFVVPKGHNHDLPFSLPTPRETPLTTIYGRRLPGLTIGLRTE